MNKHIIKIKETKAITLIALVITIIVILILAGVTINTITSQEGILGKARLAVDNNAKQAIVDQIKLEIVGLKAESTLGIVTYDQIINKLIEKGITEEDLVDNEARQIITEEGYKIAIIENGTNSWNVEFVEALGSKDIIITSKLYPDAEITTPEEQITIKVMQPTDGIKKITMPDGTVKTYTGKNKVVEETFEVYVNDTYTFIIETNSGEIKNYDVKISNVDVGSIAIAADQSNWVRTIEVEVLWPENRANLTQEISTNNGTTYHTYNGKEEVTSNTTVKARLTKNGTVIKEAEPLQISKIDRSEPTATISDFQAIKFGLSASISSTDTGGSGLKLSDCKYTINKNSKEIGTDASLYTDGTITKNTVSLKKAKPAGTYFLHVLLADNAGNKKEVISSSSVQVTTTTVEYGYTGSSVNEALIPGKYKVQLWGASGGGADPGTGGDGGFISGNLSFNSDTTVSFLVGQGGKYGSGSTNASTKTIGFGGISYGGKASCYGGSGGGGTFLYLNNDLNTAANILMVAGGGGGASDQCYAQGSYSYGGYYAAHNTNNGGDGTGNTSGTRATGGTQTEGGTPQNSTATAGSFLNRRSWRNTK